MSNSEESNADYQLRMDRLALKVNAILEGEGMLDVATVCSGLAAYAIANASSSAKQRESLLEQLFEFMRRRMYKHAEEEPHRDN